MLGGTFEGGHTIKSKIAGLNVQPLRVRECTNPIKVVHFFTITVISPWLKAPPGPRLEGKH